MENSIIIITVLISLSYISERLCNLLKLYLPEKWISSLKSNNKVKEKKREKKILLISILSGIITSSLFFVSITQDEFKSIFSFDMGEWWQTTLIIILTGVLLSFGSKFWHDLLDIVMSIKNIKQTKAEEKLKSSPSKETQIETPEDDVFKNLSHEEQRKIINECIRVEASNLKKEYPEIQGMSARRKIIKDRSQNYYCLHIDIIKKKTEIKYSDMLPASINFKTSDNKSYKIPTAITGVGKNELSQFIGDGEMPKKLGLSCSRKDSKRTGTIGLKVYKDGIPYLLSCYHVLCAPEMEKGTVEFNSNANSPQSNIVISPGTKDGDNNQEIAEVTEGYLSNHVDVAIARLKDVTYLDNEYYKNNGKPQGLLKLTHEHTSKQISVKLFGKTSGMKRGRLIDHYQEIVYFNDYPDNTIKELYGLIVTEKISGSGDSGATVLNRRNEIIGLLVGGNDNNSYVIPIDRIFNKLRLDNNLN